MSRLTLSLPETLQHQLKTLARTEGVSLNQYILFALTRQVRQAYNVEAVPENDIDKQRTSYANLLNSLGKASFSEIEKVMGERDVIKPEKGLSSRAVKRLRDRIKRQSTRA